MKKLTNFKERILNGINDQMSKEIKRSKKLKASDKLILSTIMSWERQDKECWMSAKSLADENGLGVATVERGISTLKKLDIILINKKQQFGKELNVLSINYKGLECLLNSEAAPLQVEKKIEVPIKLVITKITNHRETTLEEDLMLAEKKTIQLEETDIELPKEKLIEVLKQNEPNKEYAEFIQEYIEDDTITTELELKEYLYKINNPQTKTYKYEQQKN